MSIVKGNVVNNVITISLIGKINSANAGEVEK